MIFVKPKLKQLANGIKIILLPLDWTESIHLHVFVRAGSRYEEEKINGAAHFIEHMMFKGTKKRPNTLAISRELDRIGAQYNAYTAKDHTGYWITALAKHSSIISDVLFDMLLNSKFDSEEVEKERKVILEEIKMYKENPMLFIEDLYDNLIYYGSSLGWDIAGTFRSMSRISRDDLLNFKNSFYQGHNLVITVAGKIQKRYLEEIEKHAFSFGYLSSRKKYQAFKFSKVFPIKVEYRDLKQVQLALGFPAYPYLHPKLPALQVLNVILGGSMSSRLFIEVRERRGLAYFIRSEINQFTDAGDLKIRAGIDVDRFEEALKVILSELEKIKEGVTLKEVKEAQEFIRGRLILSLESPENQGEWYGRQEILLKKFITPQEKIRQIESVTPDAVKKVARELINKKKMRLALIGPWKSGDKFLEFFK